MRRIVLRYGLASGAVLLLLAAIVLPLCLSGVVDFDNSEIAGYSVMVLAFLLVFAGIRSYRNTVGGGAITFGKAFQVGILITLITCAVYVVAWEITYFFFYPEFFDQYSAHVLDKMRAAGESQAAILKTTESMAKMGKLYTNPLWNSAITFMEVFPVGLIVTLVSAAILRRKPGAPGPTRSADPRRAAAAG